MNQEKTKREYIITTREDTKTTILFSPTLEEMRCLLLKEEIEKVETITLPRGMKKILDNALENAYNLFELKLPYMLESIGARAFANCKSLEQVIIPDKTSVIEKAAFYGCDKLKKVVLPKGLKKFEENVFGDCPLESVTIHASYKEMSIDVLYKISRRLPKDEINKFDLIIKYSSYDELLNLVNIISKEKKLLHLFPNLTIILEGENLSYFQKNKLRRTLAKFKAKVDFKQPEENIIKRDDSIYDSKSVFSIILNKIDELKKEFSTKISAEIDQMILAIYDEYLEKTEKKSSSSPEKEATSPNALLFDSLTNLLSDLSRNQFMLSQISQVHTAKELFETKEVSEEPDNHKRLDDIVKTIKYIMSKYEIVFGKASYDSKETEQHGGAIRDYDEFLKKYDDDLEAILKRDNIEKANQAAMEVEKFKKEAEDTLASLKLYLRKTFSYMITYNAVALNPQNNYIGETVISQSIGYIRERIPLIKTEENRKEIEDDLQNFCTIYRDRLISKLHKIAELPEDDYTKLEEEMLKAISPIMMSLNSYVPDNITVIKK